MSICLRLRFPKLENLVIPTIMVPPPSSFDVRDLYRLYIHIAIVISKHSLIEKHFEIAEYDGMMQTKETM